MYSFFSFFLFKLLIISLVYTIHSDHYPTIRGTTGTWQITFGWTKYNLNNKMIDILRQEQRYLLFKHFVQ